jgi:hypothetical protein
MKLVVVHVIVWFVDVKLHGVHIFDKIFLLKEKKVCAQIFLRVIMRRALHVHVY